MTLHLVFLSHAMMHYDTEHRLWSRFRDPPPPPPRCALFFVIYSVNHDSHIKLVLHHLSRDEWMDLSDDWTGRLRRLRYCGPRFPDSCPVPEISFVRSFIPNQHAMPHYIHLHAHISYYHETNDAAESRAKRLHLIFYFFPFHVSCHIFVSMALGVHFPVFRLSSSISILPCVS